MHVEWSVEERDILAVRSLIEAAKGSRFVANRIERNVTGRPPKFCRDEFWRVMLGCLLTTQQRSGPESAVSRFLRRKPFQPTLADCSPKGVRLTLQQALSQFGGIRRAPTIAEQADKNARRLDAGAWREVEVLFGKLLLQRSRSPQDDDVLREREAAAFLTESVTKFAGFGPKQSRNLWQWLGLTRFETPLDSRVVDRLNEQHILPFKLSATALADENYYGFVMSGIQALCRTAGVLPCVLDGAVFASYGRDWQPGELDN